MSDKMVIWQCPVSTDHTWPATVGNRSLGRGCPHCRLTRASEKEIRLAHELSTVLHWDSDLGTVTLPSGKYWHVDICFPDQRLIVEYDGAWWHTGKETKDRVKSDSLASDGWHVVRVRVHPLPLEQGPARLDVPAVGDEAAHVTARRVLEMCVERGWLTGDVLESYGKPTYDKAEQAADAAIAEHKRLLAADLEQAESIDNGLEDPE